MNSGSAQRDDIFEMIVGKGETGPAEDSEQAPFISVPERVFKDSKHNAEKGV